MKKIVFIRHGKAENPDPRFPDFERSLTGKGKIISKMMAKRFAKKEKNPGTIITSPAFRALETAIIFAVEFNIDPGKIIINQNLYYQVNYLSLYEALSQVDEAESTVTLFGHNPSFTEIADDLCIEGCNFIPKSGIAGISFNITIWSDLNPSTGKLEYFLKPEKLL
jgi:phosphohistidine phosphatase